jgi:PiT family inorganic phosphate transporter
MQINFQNGEPTVSQAILTQPALAPRRGPDLDRKPHASVGIGFAVVLVGGLAYMAYSVLSDVHNAGGPVLATGAYMLLGLALLIALGFEFVNGFHDTANAVATVIYTHSLPAQVAVIWSGFFNFLGVLTSSGTVAFTIVSLLPVELILQVGTGAGYAMIFALLIAAIIWNLGTWALGLPASSSHTLIGSIIGVGLANELMNRGSGVSGVDWSQVWGVFKALLVSPVVGFLGAAGLLLAMKALIRSKQLYAAPEGNAPPPTWIRGLLILTCTGVSFAHGSNDGQKGMGLIMLILIGAAPTAYALNRALPDSQTPGFMQHTQEAQGVFTAHADGIAVPADRARGIVTDAIRDKSLDKPEVFAAMSSLAGDMGRQVQQYGAIARVPAEAVQNVRNDMYLASEAVRLMQKGGMKFGDAEDKALKGWKGDVDSGTKFIPLWVKVSVAVALGLGTMIGWKRIVVTVGERIGKTHLSYGQGAAAEIVAALTIGAADVYGLPVSTTHVLSSGVAGTMAANGSGLQWSTVRNIAMAWVLTLPAAAVLAGVLYFLLRMVF